MTARLVWCVLVLLSAGLGGCATVAMTAPALDAEGKTFSPASGKANIYVNRGGGIGTAVVYQVMLDGRIVGGIAPNTYHLLSVPPGDHTVGVASMENVEQLTIEAEAGRNYFFAVTPRMGWSAGRAGLKAVDEADGMKRVKKSKRASSAVFG